MLKRPALRRLAILWIVCLIVLSLQAVRPNGNAGRSFQHQVSHVVAFAATALLLLALARTAREEWIAAALVVALAIAIEFMQMKIYFLPGLEWWDVREDSIGVLLAVGLIRSTRIRPVILSEP